MKAKFKEGFFVFFLFLAFLLLGLPKCSLANASATSSTSEADAEVWDDESEMADFDRFYLNVSGGMLLPGNGVALERAALVDASVGWYWLESLALEGHVLSAPNTVCDAGGNEALSGAGLNLLWHVLGYERFDPFLTVGEMTLFGARHVFGDASHRTATGPTAGVGAFWHLTESWSLRGDARSLLVLDSPCGMVYTVSVGIQRSF